MKHPHIGSKLHQNARVFFFLAAPGEQARGTLTTGESVEITKRRSARLSASIRAGASRPIILKFFEQTRPVVREIAHEQGRREMAGISAAQRMAADELVYVAIYGVVDVNAMKAGPVATKQTSEPVSFT